MARPKKTGMDYFPHDTDAASDEKIEVLRAIYGNDGYAFYFIMLERIYRSEGFELKLAEVSESETGQKLVKNDAETIVVLSKKLMIDPELFEKILSTCMKREIFSEKKYTEKGVVTSDGIKKRAKPITEKRRKMAKIYKEKPIVSGEETQQKQGRNQAETKQKPHKGKERKEEESIGENKEPLCETSGDQPELFDDTAKLKEQPEKISPQEQRLKDFDLFWDAFEYKKSKSDAKSSWLKITKYTPELLEMIIAGAEIEAKNRPVLIANGRTPIFPQGWITKKRWEDYEDEIKEKKELRSNIEAGIDWEMVAKLKDGAI